MLVEQEDEAKSIADMDRVQAFLADAAVKDAIKRVHEKNYALFEAATTPDLMVVAHARAVALKELIAELGATIGKGEFHKASRDRRAPQKK